MKTTAIVLAGLLALTARAVTFHEAVEADWLRQIEKRSLPATPAGKPQVTVEEDAAGAVDSVKDGKWGFHTEYEVNPWWQVDLGESRAVGRLVLWNRCDSCGARNNRILVLVSDDGKTFRQVYQHNGTVFCGFTDKKPLVAELKGVTARFVRLALSGKVYLHLDEVEIFAVGSDRNIALGKPATQSSVSTWSAKHGMQVAEKQKPREYPFSTVIERGLRLAESQRRLGVKVDDQIATLKQVAAEVKRLPTDASDEVKRVLYFRAQWAVRQMALANPLLNFDRVLFVKHAPGMFPHMSDQHYGWWSRPGGGIYVLENFKSGQPRVRCLTSQFAPGSFIGPDISYDAKKVLFAYCRHHPELPDVKNKADKANVPEDAFYHVFEMNVDGSGLRQITRGKYDDFDPRWLPDGDIAFLSTRKGLALQCSAEYSNSTRDADLPDSYVRCGGDNYRPVPVFTLHAMNARGENLRPLSAFENFEWTPSLANDGRILYARWDYIDRFNGPFISLWSANQDGSSAQLVYGNYTVKPQLIFEARAIPGSPKLVFTASAHHSITGGSLCLLDRARGTEEDAPITRLTPEVCYPETEGSPEHYYANPYPLSEEYFLVGWADHRLPPHCRVDDGEHNPRNAMGIYLYDAFGNLELLHRDPEISSMYPLPIVPRVKPPAMPAVAKWNGEKEGRFLVQDVYRGLDGVARGSVKALRIIGVPPKVQPHMNNPVLGVSREDPGKFVLGTVPVESDGSAHFRVPSGMPMFMQALDENGVALQTMRSLTYVVPNQTLSCIGCHEHRDDAPVVGKAALAALREVSKITPGPSGSWPLRYDQLVQPVLDAQCVRCHQSGSSDAKAAKLDLTPAKSYTALLSFAGEDLKKQAFERNRSVAGEGTAASSKLWQLLTAAGGHEGVRLDKESLDRFATWMDTYAHRVGHFSDDQERKLQELRANLASLFREPLK